MLNNISKVFKAITGFIYLIPGLSLFFKYSHPVNVSKPLIIALAQGMGTLVIILVILCKKNIKTIKINNIIIISISLSIFTILSIIAFSFFSSSHITTSYDNTKILLPWKLKGSILKMERIAEKNNQTIGERYGVDIILKQVDTCCENEQVISEILYDLFFMIPYLLTVFIFVFLGYRLDKNDFT